MFGESTYFGSSVMRGDVGGFPLGGYTGDVSSYSGSSVMRGDIGM